MIEGIFDTDKSNLSVIINQKQVIQNISYKIFNDKNVIDFFDNLIKNIENYDQRNDDETKERMHYYYFINDLKEMYKVLNLFYQGLKTDYILKNKTADELAKCCSVFPDHIGERILKTIAYIPIINIFYEKIKYIEYIKGKRDLNKSFMGETILEYQEDRLFNPDSIMRTKFPDDDEFIDYAMKNRYIEKLEKEFKDNNKIEEINASLNHFIELFNKSNDKDKSLLLIGMTYWEEKRNISSKNSEQFKETIKMMSKSFDKENQIKLDKIKLILIDEIENKLNFKINNIEFKKKSNNNYSLLISCNEIINDENIKLIEKIFFIKKDYEIIEIKYLNFEKHTHQNKKDEEFIYNFDYKIELN